MSEQWRPVPGYEGWYEVSDLGNVRSWKNNRWGRASTPTPKRANPSPRDGRLRVSLWGADHCELRSVHRLVLEAFVGPNPPEKWHGAHRNGDCLDNRLTNLYWATPAENGLDSARHGIHKGSRHGNAKLVESQIPAIRALAAQGMKQQDIADRYGVKHVAIWQVVNRRTWAHVG